MFWLSRWTYSGVPGFGPAACDGAASARASRAARRQMRPIAGSVTRWDATQNACVAWGVVRPGGGRSTWPTLRATLMEVWDFFVDGDGAVEGVDALARTRY